MSAIILSIRSNSPQGLDPHDAHATGELDATCALLALMVQSQVTAQSGAKTTIEIDAQKLQELKQQLAHAVEQAQEASKHAGFWGFIGKVLGGDVAKIAGAVASIAAVVATGGAGAPFILLALSVALQVGAKVGSELGLDPKLCAGLSIASAAIGLCSGTGSAQSASTLAQTMHAVSLAGNATAATASGAGAACTYRGNLYHADDLDHQADAVGLRGGQTAVNLDLDDAFSFLNDSLHVQSRETDTAGETEQNDADAKMAILNRI